MQLGTKSVLYGAHQFAIHPWFVAVAWWKLFGFPVDPRLWVAFFVHDLGYIGKPNMDGPEGERHVLLGAKIMSVFGKDWSNFSQYHSRFWAKQNGVQPSRLCIADKLAICLTPHWLYLPAVRLTGEIKEYMKHASQNREGAKYATMNLATDGELKWYLSVQTYLRKWVEEHKDGRQDSWTPIVKQPKDEHGVWQ